MPLVFSIAAYDESGLFTHVATTDSHVNARPLVAQGLIVRSCAPLFVPFLRRER